MWSDGLSHSLQTFNSWVCPPTFVRSIGDQSQPRLLLPEGYPLEDIVLQGPPQQILGYQPNMEEALGVT